MNNLLLLKGKQFANLISFKNLQTCKSVLTINNSYSKLFLSLNKFRKFNSNTTKMNLLNLGINHWITFYILYITTHKRKKLKMKKQKFWKKWRNLKRKYREARQK
jgi:hypothetical protein